MRRLLSAGVLAVLMLCGAFVAAQDASTGALRGTVSDASGARVIGARVLVEATETGVARATTTGDDGVFVVQMLVPGEYRVSIEAAGMAPQKRAAIKVDLGAEVELSFTLRLPGTTESLTVEGGTPLVETVPSAISNVLDERAINELPLNGRRFSDLALLTPGVTEDPRGLTSASKGDLAFGGIRGFQTSFLVDGADNNNGFFGQARGRYRAPYQFSNEVIQEFRVSSNTYGAELGRSGGAVINVATKSGSNRTHGSAFYYVRDSSWNAQNAFMEMKPADRQSQFGVTIGGPIKKNRVFYFASFDQHVFHVPTVVQFLNHSSLLTPSPADYEVTDQAQVFAAANQLSQMGGAFGSHLLGNAGFAKIDATLTPHHQLSVRVNTSRYYGTNNVFFDPSSPITTKAMTQNGEEDVATESTAVSLTSGLSHHITSHLRLQFSRDLQQSEANSADVQQKIYSITDGFGRNSILPRDTREHRWHLAVTISLDGKRHSRKFGADLSLTRIRNFFPLMYGGEYIFDDIKVNPFTFAPQVYGLELTPLRAYAHEMPRYYLQNFGDAVSHPDTNEYAGFVQDTVRVTNHLGLTLGLRYDLQTFGTSGLVSNPLWPDSGKVPTDTNNFAPRVGFAYSLGDSRPLVVRGGWGMFYTRIPQIYTSAVENGNGLNSLHLLLDNADYWDRVVFPQYPAPLVACPPTALSCSPPASVAGKLTSEISSFAHDFRTPVVQQASLGLEKEIMRRLAVGVNYMYVHGEHLIRARDVNLPSPVLEQYPVFDWDGQNFLGKYYTVASFTPWVKCSWGWCLGDLKRPIAQLGAINEFESAASSLYNGLTISARRRMTKGFYLRLAYTWAHAIDDGQDALVAGSPSLVQNSYATAAERGASVTDQRHRLAFSWLSEPQPFHREHPIPRRILNDWKWSVVVTIGSGRPVNARVQGDANLDGNSGNDRLPGFSRNSFTGPDYATTDMRLTRKVFTGRRFRVELLAEAFNVLNRDNKRVDASDDGYYNTAGTFVAYTAQVGAKSYPAHFRDSGHFLEPNSAYAPRQLQFALKLFF